jgi:hypothetical protein
MSSRSYSRSEIIAFLTQSVKELQNMCGRFHSTEYIDKFVVRIKTMDMLAQQAFKYSIMVSYLNEHEYVAIADTLDDVYLHQSRIRLSHMANKHGELVAREYEDMRTNLDLIDERLKTVKIVCAKPRHNNNARQKKSRENLRHIHIQEEEFNECGVGDVFERRPPRNKKTLNPDAKEFVPETESKKKYKHFHETIANYLKIADELNVSARQEMETNPQILQSQYENIRDMYDFIVANAEYISTDKEFRKPVKKTGYSFMQSCIRKCFDLKIAIFEQYKVVKSENYKLKLCSAELACLKSIDKAFFVLSKYYEENPVEKESIEEMLSDLVKNNASGCDLCPQDENNKNDKNLCEECNFQHGEEDEELCENCGKNPIAPEVLCGFEKWCEGCDTSLYSTKIDFVK